MRIPLTVAVPTYNRLPLLKEALDSIRSQSYSDFELLVLDNYSTDGTPDYVINLKDSRIRYIRNPPNHSADFNGHSALTIARGRRLLIFHDDDIMEPGMLEKAMSKFDQVKDLAAVWCNHSLINPAGESVSENAHPSLSDFIFPKYKYIEQFPLLDLWTYPSGLVFTPAHYPRYGNRYYLDKDLPTKSHPLTGGDPLVLISMNAKGPVAIIGEPLYRYRRHPNQETHKQNIYHPITTLYKALINYTKKIPLSAESRCNYRLIYTRYTAQSLIVDLETWPPNRIVVEKIIDCIRRMRDSQIDTPAQENVHSHLIDLLANLLANWPISASPQQRVSGGAMRALVAWMETRRDGNGLFSRLSNNKKIAVLGTSLVGALLLIEAKYSGFKELLVLDSNRSRVGKRFLGEVIQEPEVLTANGGKDYLVITTSERDHEPAIFDFIRRIAPEVSIKSWKDIAGGPFKTGRFEDA